MLSEEQLAVLEDAVADIDEMGDAERYAWRQTARLLADYRELLAEVERLQPLAAVGEAVGKLEDGGR